MKNTATLRETKRIYPTLRDKPDKPFFEISLERSTTKGSSFGRIMRLWVQIRATDEER